MPLTKGNALHETGEVEHERNVNLSHVETSVK